MLHTVIVTATEWDNFFNLRCHPDAHPDIRRPAEMMKELAAASKPQLLSEGEWHLPLVDDEEIKETRALGIDPVHVSVGRCARVSYLTHGGVRDFLADVELHDRLKVSGHLSPFEHVARVPYNTDVEYGMAEYGTEPPLNQTWFGNLRGWLQYRKTIDRYYPRHPDNFLPH